MDSGSPCSTGSAGMTAIDAMNWRTLALGRFHLDGDPRSLLIADGDVRRRHPQAFVPDLQLVLAGRKIVEGEHSIRAGDRVEGMRRNDHPPGHPRVEVAVDAHDLRLVKSDWNGPALRLRSVERSVELGRGMNVVKEAVAVEKVDGTTGGNEHDPRNELASILIHLDFFGLSRRGGAGWRVLEPYHGVPQ